MGPHLCNAGLVFIRTGGILEKSSGGGQAQPPGDQACNRRSLHLCLCCRLVFSCPLRDRSANAWADLYQDFVPATHWAQLLPHAKVLAGDRAVREAVEDFLLGKHSMSLLFFKSLGHGRKTDTCWWCCFFCKHVLSYNNIWLGWWVIRNLTFVYIWMFRQNHQDYMRQIHPVCVHSEVVWFHWELWWSCSKRGAGGLHKAGDAGTVWLPLVFLRSCSHTCCFWKYRLMNIAMHVRMFFCKCITYTIQVC